MGTAGLTDPVVGGYTEPYGIYGTDGRLIAVPNRQDYGPLRLEDWSLVPVQTEIWQGFVFVRLARGGGRNSSR